MIRPMLARDESAVRAIYAACHPTWPAQPPRFYEAHPTLVLEREREILGSTSYSLIFAPDQTLSTEVMYGHGIDIRPGHHGQGYARALCDERLAVARAVGATLFIGHAAPDNHAMMRLFDRDGFKPYGEARDPDGRPIQLYIGPVQ